MSRKPTDKFYENLHKMFDDEEIDRGQISDGYHTFNELYEHRNLLWMNFCTALIHLSDGIAYVWKTQRLSDGAELKDYFILGVNENAGEQMTYHLPLKYWEMCGFAVTIDKAPVFDGHTSKDVAKRLTRILKS